MERPATASSGISTASAAADVGRVSASSLTLGFNNNPRASLPTSAHQGASPQFRPSTAGSTGSSNNSVGGSPALIGGGGGGAGGGGGGGFLFSARPPPLFLAPSAAPSEAGDAANSAGLGPMNARRASSVSTSSGGGGGGTGGLTLGGAGFASPSPSSFLPPIALGSPSTSLFARSKQMMLNIKSPSGPGTR